MECNVRMPLCEGLLTPRMIRLKVSHYRNDAETLRSEETARSGDLRRTRDESLTRPPGFGMKGADGSASRPYQRLGI